MNRRPVGSVALRVAVAALAGACLLLAAYYAATALFAIANFGWRAPMSDQYRLYTFYLGLPFPENILQLENGHRPIVPAVLRMLEVHCCAANQRLQLILGAVFASLTLLVVVLTVARDRTLPALTRAAAAAVAVPGVFWLANARMLMHGNESVHAYLVTLCVVLAGLLAHRAAASGRLLPLFGATLSCCVATFSFGPGMAAFPAMLLVLALHRVPIRMLAIPAVGLFACLVVYLLVLPGDAAVRRTLVFAPLDSAAIALKWIASPWVHAWLSAGDGSFQDWLTRGIADAGLLGTLLQRTAQPVLAWWGGGMDAIRGIAGLMGGLGLAAWAWAGAALWRSRGQAPAAEWLAFTMASFALATAALVSIARADYFPAHPGQLFADRYLVWPSVFWSAIAVQFLLRLGAAGTLRQATAGLVAMVLLLALYPSHRVLADWSTTVHRSSERVFAAAWLGIRGRVFPDGGDATASQVDTTLALMRARKLGPFAEPPPVEPGERIEVPQDAACGKASIMSTWASPAHGGGQVLQFEGWCTEFGDAWGRWLAVVDGDGRVAGLARYSWIRRRAPGLRLAVTEKHGYDGFIVGYGPGTRYRVVLQDPAGAWHTVAFVD